MSKPTITVLNNLNANNFGNGLKVGDGYLTHLDAKRWDVFNPNTTVVTYNFWKHCFDRHKEAYYPGTSHTWKVGQCAGYGFHTQGFQPFQWYLNFVIECDDNTNSEAIDNAPMPDFAESLIVTFHYVADDSRNAVYYYMDIDCDGSQTTGMIGTQPALAGA